MIQEDKLKTVHANFIKAMRLIILDTESIETEADFARWLGISKQIIYSIREGRMPTVEQILLLCEKGGFNANWMLRDIGDPRLEDQNDIDKVMKELKSIKAKVAKLS